MFGPRDFSVSAPLFLKPNLNVLYIRTSEKVKEKNDESDDGPNTNIEIVDYSDWIRFNLSRLDLSMYQSGLIGVLTERIEMGSIEQNHRFLRLDLYRLLTCIGYFLIEGFIAQIKGWLNQRRRNIAVIMRCKWAFPPASYKLNGVCLANLIDNLTAMQASY